MTNQLREVVADALPELPEPHKKARKQGSMAGPWDIDCSTGGPDYYTADQMREYARAALATLPSQSAGVEERARELQHKFAFRHPAETDEQWAASQNYVKGWNAALDEALRTPASEGDGGRVVAWIRFCSDGLYEGPIHDSQLGDIRRNSGAWTPLYPPTQQEVRAVDDEMVERAARIVAELAGEDFDLIGGFAQGILLDTQRAALTAALQAGTP